MSLYERYRDREMAATRLQAELATARLQALRGHLQPHFLFNSLHSVAALARAGDTAGVVRLVAALSELLRYVLEAGDRHGTLRASRAGHGACRHFRNSLRSIRPAGVRAPRA